MKVAIGIVISNNELKSKKKKINKILCWRPGRLVPG
jgi:hypothetical protein